MKRGKVFYRGKVVEVFEDEDRLFSFWGEMVEREKITFLPPFYPSKIVCVGRNYALHAKELGNKVPEEPLIFLKASSSILAHKGAIVIPSQSEQVEYEGEIGVALKKRAKNLDDTFNINEYIKGVFPLNDVTARDLQSRDVQFTSAKSFDTFCPFGPFYEDSFNLEDISVKTRLNGEIKQIGQSKDMVFSIRFLLSYISKMMTLEEDDIIATGTPEGVGKIKRGDLVEVEVSSILLQNVVV